MLYNIFKTSYVNKKIFLYFLFLFISGCGLKDMFFKKSNVWLNKINFKASRNANSDSPITVHAVIVYNEDLLKELLKMDSEDYFTSLNQLKMDNANNIEVLSKDIVPGQSVSMQIEPKNLNAEGIVIFARYSSKGNHRLKVGEESEITILLEKTDFKLKKEKVKA